MAGTLALFALVLAVLLAIPPTASSQTPPDVTVSFGSATYTVAEFDNPATTDIEENEVTVTVSLSADPQRTVVIPITTTHQGGVLFQDYTGVPASLTFNSGDTSKSFTFTAAADDVDDDGESVKLAFGTLPTGVTAATPVETTVSITNVRMTFVTFNSSFYSATEGGGVTITLNRKNSAGHEIVVPITVTYLDGATADDLAGLPSNVTFEAGKLRAEFRFTVVSDGEDPGESVQLGLGPLPDGYMTLPEGGTALVHISDGGEVTVGYSRTLLFAREDGYKFIAVELSAEPGREVTIPIAVTHRGGATAADYSGVPSSLTFASDEQTKYINFRAVADGEDDGESVVLGFGASMPAGVSAGKDATATVWLNDGGQVQLGLTQVGIGVTAALYHRGRIISNEAWQWQRSATETGLYTDIPAAEGGTSNLYVPSEDDLGMWLKATVTYDAGSDRGKTAQGTALQPVLPQPAVSNAGHSRHNFLGFDVSEPVPYRYAQGFTTGSDTRGYRLTGVRLPLYGGADPGGEYTGAWGVHADDGGKPAAEPLVTELPIPNSDLDESHLTFLDLALQDGLMLEPSTRYWIVISQASHRDAGFTGFGALVSGKLGDNLPMEEGSDTPYADSGSKDGWSIDLEALSYYINIVDESFVGNPTPAIHPWTELLHMVEADRADLMVLRMAVVVVPDVRVQFDADTYTVDEGGTGEITVKLSTDAQRTLTIPITATEEDGAAPADYGVPTSVTFKAGERSKTITFTATQDTLDDDDESVTLALGTMPDVWARAGDTDEATVSIRDDDDPEVTVSFGASTYAVDESDDPDTTPAEEHKVTVTLTLDADPERTVDIPLTKTNLGGATSADYSGVPASVTFNAGETSKSFTFTAVSDTVDDDDESVKLGFGTLPSRVSAGTTAESTVSIRDDDDPEVTVTFVASAYYVAESDDPDTADLEENKVTVTLTLSADPERTVAIPISTTNQGGASDPDYSGVPASVTFVSGETSKSFTFMAAEDTVDDKGESVKLSFGTLPHRVTEGFRSETTIFITDECAQDDIWCAEVEFRFKEQSGPDLRHTKIDRRSFEQNSVVYKISTIWVRGAYDTGDISPPFLIPERTKLIFSLEVVGSEWWSTLLNDDPGDWTLLVSTVKNGETRTATLPFSEAKSGDRSARWDWYGRDVDDLRLAWSDGKAYRFRIVQDLRSDRTPQAPGPPLYLRTYRYHDSDLWLVWEVPQQRDDSVPQDVTYKLQWKLSTGSWDTPADVSQLTYGATSSSGNFGTIRGLSPGTAYDIRVIAGNSVGDGPPSNVITYTTPGAAQQSPANSEATGAPTISGTAQVYETLTADTSGISDPDGLDSATFAYQWLRGSLEIQGATARTYTVVDGDAGFLLSVRVTFTDDAGNPESLTSERTSAVVQPPLTLKSATVGGASLKLTYSHGLNEQADPSETAFTVTVNGTAVTVSDVSVSGSVVTLALGSAVVAGDTVTVGYERPTGGDISHVVRDVLGRPAETFSGQEVTNDTAAAANNPATGTPAIGGTAQVGQTLTVSTTGIADADGLTNVSYTYNWLADDTAISGATGSSYTLVAGDQGKAIKVTVSFSDDAGNAETRTSIATAAVAAANNPATGTPTISGTAQVGETLTVSTTGIADADGLTNVSYSYQWLADDVEISGATGSGYTLTASDQGKAIKARVSFTDDAGNAETLTSIATAAVAAANNSATGSPTIGGTAQVGETLTVSTTGIADTDGLTNATFTYQWLADDTEISGATDSSYTLVAGDQSKAIKVKVSFTDDAGNAETLTSIATASVAAANNPATGSPAISGTAQVGQTLTVSTTGIADTDGLTNVTYGYQWLADDTAISGATGSSYTLVAGDRGKAIKARVSFTDDAGNAESLTSAATAAVAGLPLTATASKEPASHDGSATFTFELHFSEEFPLSFRTLRDHAFTVTGGEVSRARRLVDGSDAGWRIHVEPSGNGAVTVVLPPTTDCAAEGAICTADGRKLSSRVEVTVPGPLTATASKEPASHDGSASFTFELHFSEEPSLSFRTLRDHAFTVTGGEVLRARRLVDGSDAGWRIRVEPSGNGAVTVVLPPTTDCEAEGAICTADGRKLSNRVEVSVPGPG